MESQKPHAERIFRQPVRYVVIIDSGDSTLARLMLDTRQQLEEMDAATPEVLQMIQGLVPIKSAGQPEWDDALQGHSQAERSRADVYKLTL